MRGYPGVASLIALPPHSNANNIVNTLGGITVLGNVRVVRNVLALAAVPLWGLVIASMWSQPVDARAMPVVRDAAVAAFVGALTCWASRRGRDEDADDGKRPLVRELVNAYLDEMEPRRQAFRRFS